MSRRLGYFGRSIASSGAKVQVHLMLKFSVWFAWAVLAPDFYRFKNNGEGVSDALCVNRNLFCDAGHRVYSQQVRYSI